MLNTLGQLKFLAWYDTTANQRQACVHSTRTKHHTNWAEVQAHALTIFCAFYITQAHTLNTIAMLCSGIRCLVQKKRAPSSAGGPHRHRPPAGCANAPDALPCWLRLSPVWSGATCCDNAKLHLAHANVSCNHGHTKIIELPQEKTINACKSDLPRSLVAWRKQPTQRCRY